jgi:N-acetylneuraminic acid mutarotase
LLGRVLRLAAVAVVGIALAVGGYLAVQLLTSPNPKEARDWELLATLPNARGETAAAVAGGRLYVLGGLSGLGLEATAEATRYDPATDRWETLPALPAARHHAAAAALDGTVYLSGGGSSTGPARDLWALSIDGGTWSALAPMPEPRFSHRMLAVEGRLYVVGGRGGSSVLIYDPATDSWSSGAEMPAPRDHLAAVAVGDEIWAIGGRIEGEVQDRVDIYDIEADAWRAGPALPQATSAASEGLLGSVILVSGGEYPARDLMVDAHWQLDTALGDAAEWEPLSPPPLTVHGAHGAVLGDRLLIAGGASRPGPSSRFAWSGLLQAYTPPG